MLRLGRLITLAIGGLAVTGCATMTVGSHVQTGVDFAQYRTYDWGPPDALPTSDPRLDNNLFFQDHMMGAVQKQMAARGYVLSTSAFPDLLIHYHASINQRIDVSAGDAERGYCRDEDCNVRVFDYEASTLVLDIVDAHTDRLIWRGWAQDDVGDVLNNMDRMERKINQAVTRMLARLPPRL